MITFERVRRIGVTLPGVEAATRYNGLPVLKVGGRFMATLATHPSAEPGTLVVRADPDDRPLMLEDAPETYYLTEYYRKYPVVLVRLSAIHRDTLRDVLAMSRRLTLTENANRNRRTR